MKDQKIVEEMARLEGKWPDVEGEIEWIEKSYRFFYDVTTFENGSQFRFSHMMPDYPNSHDACQRVIDGMSIKELTKYHTEIFGHPNRIAGVRATPRQKCEAILKAANKWDG